MGIRMSVIVNAIVVNAEREHFAEAYEGFNDCRSLVGEPCDCGKTEADEAYEELEKAGYIKTTDTIQGEVVVVRKEIANGAEGVS